MIIISHKEILAQGGTPDIFQPHVHIQRPYTNTDLIIKRGEDYESVQENTITLTKNQLEELIKRTHEHAYNIGYKEAVDKMMY